MPKILLTLRNVENYIEDNRIIIEKNMILSSSVKDYLAEKGIEISYERKCNQDNGENLKKKIERILKDEYQISDEKIVELILKKICKGEK